MGMLPESAHTMHTFIDYYLKSMYSVYSLALLPTLQIRQQPQTMYSV